MKNFMEILCQLNLITIGYADSIEDTPVKLSSVSNSSTSNIGSLIAFLFTFLIITGVLVFIFIVISKKNKLDYAGNKSIKVLDKIKVDHNSNLYAIKIQDQIHIIGKTDNCMTPISVISDKDKIQQLELDSIKNQEQTFQSVFNEQLSSLNNNTSTYIKSFKVSTNTAKAFKFNSKK